MRLNSIENLSSAKQTAEQLYFQLKNYYGTDRAIANALSPEYKRSADVIRRNLGLFAFRNQKSTQDFISAAEVVLTRLKKLKPRATALLLIGSDLSPLVLRDTAKGIMLDGINIIAPQAYFSDNNLEFWEHFKADMEFANFIITRDLTKSQLQQLEYLQSKHSKDLQVFEYQEMEEIKAFAIQLSLLKNSKRQK